MIVLWLLVGVYVMGTEAVVSGPDSFFSILSRLSRSGSSCFLDSEGGWAASIASELDTVQSSMKTLHYAMPHLSICMEAADSAPWCFPVAPEAYVSDLIVGVMRPQQSLHLWAQVTPTGGKIQQSDAYLNIDCRQFLKEPSVDRDVVGMDVHFETVVLEDCVDTRTGTHSPQELIYSTRKYYQPGLACLSSTPAVFQYHMTSFLSLQRHTTTFCSEHTIASKNCAHFSRELRDYLHRIFQGRQLQLPPVQFSPTVANPFLFMHVDKTAGSTMRMYIDDSLQDPSTAFIPCHGLPCTTFAVPLHVPLGRTVNSDVSADFDWGELADLRLVQPTAGDNSNVTVIAGHFDFFAPHDSLPRCQKPGLQGAPTESAWTRIKNNDAPVARHVQASTSDCRVSCFTMGRHPVSRAISYYYQRVHSATDRNEEALVPDRPVEQRMFNELSVEQVRHMVDTVRGIAGSAYHPVSDVIIDEGMSDGFCRALLGIKHTTGLIADMATLPPAIPPELYPQAVQNLRRCVVGMQEQWNDTLRVLDHWFPWIDFSADPKLNVNHHNFGYETRDTLRPELVKVIEHSNPCDMMIYEELGRLFKAQLGVLES